METAAGSVTLPAGALALVVLREVYAQCWTRVVPLAVTGVRMRLMAGWGRHEPAPLNRPQDGEPGLGQRQDFQNRQQLQAGRRPCLLLPRAVATCQRVCYADKLKHGRGVRPVVADNFEQLTARSRRGMGSCWPR